MKTAELRTLSIRQPLECAMIRKGYGMRKLIVSNIVYKTNRVESSGA